MAADEESFRAIISRVYLNAGADLTAGTAASLRRRVLRALDRSQETVLLVCTQVRVVDAAGLAVLVELQGEARSRGVRFRVVSPSRQLVAHLAASGTADELDLDDDTVRAVEHTAA